MNNIPNIFTSNSRYLPPPIRTVTQSHYAYRRSDSQRAAAFLNQDWTPTPTSGTSAEVFPSPSSSELPPPPPSECSHSEDGSDEDCDGRSDAEPRVKREPFSPKTLFTHQHCPPLVLPTRRASLSMNDLQSLTGRRHSVGTDSHLVSRSLGNGSPSLERRVRSSPYSPYHHQTKSWPVALHPSTSSHSHSLSSDSHHRRNLSSNSHSTGSPPPTPPTPSSPAHSAKNESAQSSTASPPAPVNTDEYIQRVAGGKSKCIWNDASGHECGFQSSSSLVKRHVRTVHLKIRYVVLSLRYCELYLPAHPPAPLSVLSAVKASRPSSISRHIRISTPAKSPTRVLIAQKPSPTLPADTTIESDTTVMCSPGGTTAIRTKKTDPPNYRGARTCYSLHRHSSHILFAFDPHHSTTPRYHRIHILIIALTTHKPLTRSALHRLSRLHPYLSSFSPLSSPMLLYASSFLNGFYVGHMPCHTYVVRYLVRRLSPGWLVRLWEVSVVRSL
jgi:hypothetical protein